MAKVLRELEESRSRLKVTVLVNDERRKHAATCTRLATRDFPEEVPEPWIVRALERDGVNVLDEFRVWNHLAVASAGDQRLPALGLCLLPCGIVKPELRHV